jgi:NitT/TauT family transport system ATP-binding protein
MREKGEVAREEVKIRIRGVERTFHEKEGDNQALDPVDLDIRKGEFFCLLGPNGCGKTTLLHLIAGFDNPSRGLIEMDGRVVVEPASRCVMIFQNYGLFPWRTVLDNVAYGLEVRGVGKKERQEKARNVLHMVGLGDVAGRYPRTLSGGMQQRAAIARALAVEPEVLLMDEPFAALDAMTRSGMQRELLRIWRESGCTIVFVTHDLDEALLLADRIAIMTAHPGSIREIVPIDVQRPRSMADSAYLEFRGKIQKAMGLL